MEQELQRWLDTATAQLRCRRAAPGVARELESHLNEQYSAFLAEGCTPGEAARKTAASMGDPVLAGGALDRIHRPRPAWGPFGAVAAALLLCGVLRWALSLPLSADGALLWRAGEWKYLLEAEAAVAVLALVCFCGDVSLLARRAWALYGGVLGVSACGMLLGGAVLNGRRCWVLPGAAGAVQYGALQFSMLFVPVWTAVAYGQRGRGWRGLAVSGAALLPGVLLCLAAPHLTAAAMLLCAGLVVCLLCCAEDWFGLGRRAGLAALLGAVGLGALAAAGWALGHGALRRLRRSLFAARDAVSYGGADYWSHGVRRLWSGMQWIGPGEDSLPLGMDAASGTVGEFARNARRTLCADYQLLYTGWRFGLLAAVLTAALLAVVLAVLWRMTLRIRSGIGRLCAAGCCTLLTAYAALYCAGSFGLPCGQSALPFFGSGIDILAEAVLAGLMLSAFRLDDVLCEPSAAPRCAAPSARARRRGVVWQDGELRIRLR